MAVLYKFGLEYCIQQPQELIRLLQSVWVLVSSDVTLYLSGKVVMELEIIVQVGCLTHAKQSVHCYLEKCCLHFKDIDIL
jgi:prefoldin subunit 5